MILVNRNFGNPVLAQAIGDMFKPTSDDGMDIEWVNHTNALASGSTLVATLNPALATHSTGAAWATASKDLFKTTQLPKNFFIVTEKFLKVLDKVYTKIWNESFTEDGIYDPLNISTLYSGFVNDTSLAENSKTIISLTIQANYIVATNFMLFKKFVDRCITAGVLDEADRLQYEDQISLSNLNKADLSTQIDLDNKLITFTAANPIDVEPDLNGLDGEYLKDKKLFLFMTPYLINESIIKLPESISTASSIKNFIGTRQEPFASYIFINNTYSNNPSPNYITPVRRPIVFFKPKTPESKFGRSLPLATHLIWRIGTPEEREIALLEGKTGIDLPELIFDHTDRISHIDSFTLKIKFDKLQF